MRKLSVIAMLAVVMAAITPLLAVEGRYPVFETGTVISESGVYMLTRDIPSNPGGPAITIAARRVVLDLNGFTIMQAPNNTDPAILVSEPKADVVIMNGLIKGGSSGIKYTGSVPGDPDDSVRIERVQVETSGSCIDVQKVSTVKVVETTLRGCNLGITVGCSGCGSRAIEGALVGNTCLQCTRGIYLADARSATIARNQILNEGFGEDAITVDNSNAVLVAENNLTHGGVKLINARGVEVRENTIHGNLTGISIGVADDLNSVSNRIIGNVIDDVSNDGIRIEGSHSYVEGNITNNCGGFGLAFGASSQGNYYRGNLAANNAGASCSNPAGADACLDGTGHLSGGDNVFAGTKQ